MSPYRVVCLSLALIALIASSAPVAFAQPLGTFRWQFAPYCNVVTLYVVQQSNTLALSGTDDQCGGPVAAAAVGTAHQNPNGSISISLVVTRPDGLAISSTIDFNLASLTGAWKDDAGNSGTFVTDPPSPATGARRGLTFTGVYSAGFLANGLNNHDVSQITFPRSLSGIALAPLTNIIPFGAPPTANCPGSFENPQAAPLQLCLYERLNSNGTYRVYNSAGVPDVGDPIGAHILTRPLALGTVGISGAWAVAIP